MSWQKLTTENKPEHHSFVQVVLKDLDGSLHVLIAQFWDNVNNIKLCKFVIHTKNSFIGHLVLQDTILFWQPITLAPLPEFNEHAGY